jgi:hypothetical protein
MIVRISEYPLKNERRRFASFFVRVSSSGARHCSNNHPIFRLWRNLADALGSEEFMAEDLGEEDVIGSG